MKYAIYGTNRVAKDFIYIFNEIEIVFFIEDSIGKSVLSYPVVGVKEAVARRQDYDKIIVCDFDKTEKKKTLDLAGMIYGADYVYEEDFFPQLDEWNIPAGKKVMVWGTGKKSEFFVREINHEIEIDGFIDNYKQFEHFQEKPVYSPDEIRDWQELFLIVAVDRAKEIVRQMENQGLERGSDFVSYQDVLGIPSRLLRKTIFDKNCYDLDCQTMLNHLEILNEGDTRCCCTTFLNQNLDNISAGSRETVWNSMAHRILCLSTENRTYTFCDKNMCPLFVAKKNAFADVDLLKNYKEMAAAPRVLAIGYDPSCNLFCETCRKEVHFAKNKEKEKIDRITEAVIKEYLPSCEFLILAGDGEVFASPAYRQLYESPQCNSKYIRLLTNGTLFTPENWARLKAGKTGRIMMTVSIDAATEETYHKIRRGGNFSMLRRNMEYASGLRKSGELDYLRFNFVVQRENYKEIIPFIEWGESLGVDEIFFTKILNWGTYTKEEFEDVSMMEADEITPKKELLEVLHDPIVANSKIVDLGTIQYGHKIDQVDIVTDYYMWELEKRGGKLFV